MRPELRLYRQVGLLGDAWGTIMVLMDPRAVAVAAQGVSLETPRSRLVSS